ncbi:(2Fe-2S)-binding protein [Paraburkholderia sp. RL18-101-BIB-B]|uniref:(2Fe-2S)-binding protein n=1 Tax=Paraburkholderia sp. RL18-101-BIB-B TaxID=3031634 RepID=UPI0038B77895
MSEVSVILKHATSLIVTVSVNGTKHVIDVPGEVPLLYILRNDLGLNGPKFGCGLGQCGACAVLVDGVAKRSCVIPVCGVDGRTVTTLEGLGTRDNLHFVQQAFVDTQAAQCGYCLNGMVIATVGLLSRNPAPTHAQICDALNNHLCRCGTHVEILDAVKAAVAHGAKDRKVQE